MRFKTIIVFALVACMVFAAPVSAKMKTHWMKKSGEYNGQMIGKTQFKETLKYTSISKKKKKEIMNLYNKNPRKLYKKYWKYLRKKDFAYSGVSVFKTKLKNNTLTVWGKLKYKGNGTKKKYKFGKYKFKLSKNAKLTYWSTVETYSHSGAKLRKEIKNPYGIDYTFVVSGGKIVLIKTLS